MRAATALLALLAACRVEGPDDRASALTDPPSTASVEAQQPGVGLPVVPSPPVEVPDTPTPPAERPVAPVLPVSPPVETASGLVIPVAGVGPGDLVDTFDDARSEGRVHDAVDILAPRGTPVVAAAAGTVVRLFESERGGTTVYQTDAATPTRVYYYAHLDAYAPGLAEGQRVEAGEALGTVGDSGNATPGTTHLHFAIWDASSPEAFWDGETVNPYPLLTR